MPALIPRIGRGGRRSAHKGPVVWGSLYLHDHRARGPPGGLICHSPAQKGGGGLQPATLFETPVPLRKKQVIDRSFNVNHLTPIWGLARLRRRTVSVFGRLGVHLPMEWILQALGATGRSTIRRRRLPAEIIVWLVIALSIFRERSTSEVVEALDLALPDAKGGFVCKSAIAQARQKIGASPFCELFRHSAAMWTHIQPPGKTWKGLTLWGMDGTSLKTPDTPENRREFRAQVYESGKESSYPQVRIVALTSLPSRILADACFGNYVTSEMRFAADLITRIPNRSLTLFDKGFFSAALLLGLTLGGDSRHFIIPALSHLRWRAISGPEDDALVVMAVSRQARIQSPDLPREWTARAIKTCDLDGKQRYLLTSLLDPREYPAEEIRDLYPQRWELETSYLEIKVRMFMNSLILRSQTPKGIRQEIWGAFIAYNLVRLAMVDSASMTGASPRRLSFTRALHLLQDELISEAVAPGSIEVPGGLIHRRRLKLAQELLPERKGRQFRRVIKSRPCRYEVRFVFTNPTDAKPGARTKQNRNKKKQGRLRPRSS